MTGSSSSASIHQSADLILKAQHVVVLTGAGISTPSGIPDFRSQHSGLWQRYDPMAVASLTSFRYNPDRFFEWIAPLIETIVHAQPNAAHLALAELEQDGHIAAVITQNIDDLHRRAGSKCVLELHGHLREAVCVSCFKHYPTQKLLKAFVEDHIIPHCPECGGILKPTIVLYGEQLPKKIVQAACETIGEADLILVAGSSLEVTPAATLPISALNRGSRLIIINHDPTYLDERADVIIHEDLATVLPKIAKEVSREYQY